MHRAGVFHYRAGRHTALASRHSALVSHALPRWCPSRHAALLSHTLLSSHAALASRHTALVSPHLTAGLVSHALAVVPRRAGALSHRAGACLTLRSCWHTAPDVWTALVPNQPSGCSVWAGYVCTVAGFSRWLMSAAVSSLPRHCAATRAGFLTVHRRLLCDVGGFPCGSTPHATLGNRWARVKGVARTQCDCYYPRSMRHSPPVSRPESQWSMLSQNVRT